MMLETNSWDDFLRQAIYERERDMIVAALDAGANANEALTYSLAEEDLDLTRRAFDAGADPNFVFDNGETPLSWAARSGRVNAVKLLIKAGAKVASECNERKLGDSISLHEAIETQNLGILELLLTTDCGPGVDWFDYVSRTPLMVAVAMNDMRSVHMLIAAGADVNAHEEAKIGDTALHIAAGNGLFEMAELLVNAGADPAIRGWMGITPLSSAQERKRPEGVQMAQMLERAARNPQPYSTIVVRNDVYSVTTDGGQDL